MGKKRGKSKPSGGSKKISKKINAKKPAKKTPAANRASKAEAPKPLKDALHELEILAEEKKIEHKVENVQKEEKQIEKKEDMIEEEEKKFEQEAKKVEGLEKKIEKEVKPKTLSGFNLKDLNKAIIGAFIGVVAHFGFIYGKAIAKFISTPRAGLLLLFSYLLIIVLMYETGYREIKEKRILGVLPKRATFVYIISLIVIIVILFLFNMLDWSDPIGLFKEIAVTSVLASVGAGTADLIGRD